MKIVVFNKTKNFPNKVNFVDTNNVFIGYDLDQICCETAFWAISETKDGLNPIFKGEENIGEEIVINDYVFDPYFIESCKGEDNGDFEIAYAVIFRLVGWKGKPDLYLRLENKHNGYYSHGFSFKGYDVIENEI